MPEPHFGDESPLLVSISALIRDGAQGPTGLPCQCRGHARTAWPGRSAARVTTREGRVPREPDSRVHRRPAGKTSGSALPPGGSGCKSAPPGRGCPQQTMGPPASYGPSPEPRTETWFAQPARDLPLCRKRDFTQHCVHVALWLSVTSLWEEKAETLELNLLEPNLPGLPT